MRGSNGGRRWISSAAIGAAAAAMIAGTAGAEEVRARFSPSGLGGNAVFGAQGTITQSTGRASALEGSGSASFLIDIQPLAAPWDARRTMRFSLWGSLGGGSAGLFGAIGSEGAYGLRWSEPFRAGDPELDTGAPLSPLLTRVSGEEMSQALIARVGYAARLQRDDRVESSLVEVPRLDLGYQLLGEYGLEVRAHAGLVVTGQLRAGEGERPLGTSIAWGSRFTLQGRSGVAEIGMQRIEPLERGQLGAMDVADARICVLASRAPGATAGLCGTGRAELSPVRLAGGAVVEATAVYGGLLIGVGVH